jgi:two-component system OmpR family sensor kinase
VSGTVQNRGTRLHRVPLRITLVALLLALVAVALTATGVAATSLLTSYLRGQQSAELRATATAYAHDPELQAACVNPPMRVLRAPTYIACLAPGTDDVTVIAAPPNRDGRVPQIDAEAVAELRDGLAPATVESSVAHSDWLMTADRMPNGYTLIVGSDVGRDNQVIGRLVAIEVIVGLIVLTLLGATGYLLVRNSLRPLGEVERTAKAIAAGDLSQRVPEGDERTEVGRLSSALNGMLARIESAFRAQQESEEHARGSAERMRRFVADASHELRTPLTSIRGFAELYRQGAVSEPAEVGRLMQRIEAEGARMGLLVEDLLLLARLDQQRPLTIAPVDLAEVAGDAVHDAAAVQPERPIDLRLDDSLTEIPVVLGDEARLRQVVGNLVTNALTHTPPTARITVTLAEDPGSPDVVVLQVADEGPGMAREHAEHVFERFYRADTARTRAAGGTGLGLSIVASLVAAHGGTVDLVTAEGRGAVFTVRLPRSGPPEDAVAAPDPEVVG